MKPITLACILLIIASSCKDKANNLLQSITGSTNEILIITNKNTWKGQLGDTIREFFGQEQVGLPQSEPIFDLLSLPHENFTRTARAHRNIFIVNIGTKHDSTTYTYFDSPWAKSQKIFKITAPNDSLFYLEFNKRKKQMMAVYLKAEKDRLVNVYKKTANDIIYKHFKDKYNIEIFCPGGFNINKDTNNFVWVSSETAVDSKGFIYFEEPYTNSNQLNDMLIIDKIKQELKKYIPGPLDSTWMTLNETLPIIMNSYKYQDKHYAITQRGLWQVENDFMGGPFVTNTILDEERNRVIYTMAYVYAPESNKRNMLRKVECIIMSMQPLTTNN